MLKDVKKKAAMKVGAARIAIVASKYNARYVDGMLRAAREVLASTKGVEFEVVRVPGAFEIPAVASALASGWAGPISALICLGVILRGETTHAQHIGESVSAALAQIQVQYRVPIVHEVLLLENLQQAEARCLAPKCNRGAEAAYTALEMTLTMRKLRVMGKKEGERSEAD